ncbi:MAG: phosphotransferase, partial [Bacteroidales bacterium]|nr:phosphotransferase [Bacteroidales bacterium]
SKCGGFSAQVISQKMTRAPMFLFSKVNDAVVFKKWVAIHFKKIKEVAENHSNHAVLESIKPQLVGKSVHLKFGYLTGDASGQNMTTTCTWHAMLWIVEYFQKDTEVSVLHFVIEGNASSDKKISHATMVEGRGINVIAECFLKEQEINKILRTTSEKMLACFAPSLAMSKIDGMIGYNINVANAIAAIFVATGQDLGSLHESSVGILTLEKLPDGLYVSLNLPSLVIGTIGGGTHLPKQKEALEIMGCYGTDKVKRFAEIIAGFSLSLEISTFAAIVSGEFAKAHEQLGRNKPINWLKKSEINAAFIQEALIDKSETVIKAEINTNTMIDNGILTDITKRVNRKLIGFIPVTIQYQNGTENHVLIKSKALDIEVIKGLHLMAASIDPELSDLIFKHKENLEYWKSHRKEIEMFENLTSDGFTCIPSYYGKYINKKNESWLFLQEFLYYEDMELYNTENFPEKWTKWHIDNVIETITKIHQNYKTLNKDEKYRNIHVFEAWKSKPLYQKLVSIMYKEADDEIARKEFAMMLLFIDRLKDEFSKLKIAPTIIHNDFNPRNVAIRKDGSVCIYDWELVVVNIPHRDIVEFLSFALNENFGKEELLGHLKYHYNLYNGDTLVWDEWKNGYIYAIKEYLVTRVSFYEVSGILTKFPFSERIRRVSFRMLEMIEEFV